MDSIMSGDQFLTLQPGTIVNARYEVVKCLGKGSMGLVYACRHRDLSGLIVAMKVLFPEVAKDETSAARFRNEIKASYEINHPNVVRAYEYFQDGDITAYTMEYVGGGDLADRLSADEEIPIDETISMLIQMASGVQAIHDAGIIHRDLKPENILLTAQGDIKITDFGIARIGSGPRLTEHGGLVGTIDYVSPEYIERNHIDERSDIYALGVLAFEMVTGQAPFDGETVIEKINVRLKNDPTPPHHLRPDCPIALSNIILKAMSRNPAERYLSAAEMCEDLESLQVGVSSVSARQKVVKTGFPVKVSEGVQSTAMTKSGTTFISYSSLGGGMSAVSPIPDPKSSTLKLNAKQVKKLIDEGEGDFIKDEELELSNQELVYSSKKLGHEISIEDEILDESSLPSISVSSSSLSLNRMKELNSNIISTGKDKLKSWLAFFAIMLAGFCLTILLIFSILGFDNGFIRFVFDIP